MKIYAKSRTISLVIGLFLILVLSGTVSAYTPSLNAQVISIKIPSSMNVSQSYPVSVTMKNTGSTVWNEAGMKRLGGVGDGSGVAAQFGPYRITLPSGTQVKPGAQYTFSFKVTAPATAGSYTAKYRMVWENHQWFGSQVSQTIQVVKPSTPAPSPTPTSTPTPSPTPTSLPSAQFTAAATSGQSPLTVQFTDQSSGSSALTYAWDFNNDGVVDSTIKNPAYTYSSAGVYTVKLTVTNANGSDSETKQSYITVTAGTVAETFGATPNPTGNPIGGGAGYSNIITETDSRVKYVVSTKDQLLTALKGAKSGDVVYVKPDASIDLTGTYNTQIPAGVTLASNRGASGSLGGIIFQNRIANDPPYPFTTWVNISMLTVGGDNVRITGLRIKGPDMTTDSSMGEETMKSGIVMVNTKGLEIDNNEISGWSFAGVYINQWYHPELVSAGFGSTEIGSAIANIHHNSIHNCQASVGYGVTVAGGTALIKANIFDFTRHAVSGAGFKDEGYEASYNIHLGNSTDAIFDVHGVDTGGGNIISGYLYRIHHNTDYAPVPSHVPFAVQIRGIPVNQVSVTDNNFFNATARSYKQNDFPVAQFGFGGFGNMSIASNVYSGKTYTSALKQCPTLNINDYSCGFF